ncbi:MAG: ABC transporter substrate-binding protein [Flavobacteriales bacterium]|nr:ABC transporter substrate-binding protein [Flavobacteriales bacterium]
MKKTRVWWSVVVAIGFGCGTAPDQNAPVASTPVAGPRYASHFHVQHRADGSQLLLVFGDRMDTVARYHVVSRGSSTTAIAGAVRLAVPLERVAVASTTHIPFFTALGKADVLTGVAHANEVRDGMVRERMRKGEVVDIGNAQGLDRERVLLLAPEAVFTYPFGGGLDPLPGVRHIPMVQVAEYLEQDPLGRAEWLRFFGLLLGKSREADSLFAQVVERYERVRSEAPSGQRPKVFFGSSWQGEWSVPSGDSHMARLIADAGGDYLFAQEHATGNIPLPREQVITYGMQAGCWGRLLAQDAPVSLLDVAGGDARMLTLPVFQSGVIFQCNSVTSDIFGRAALEPDVMLQDLRCILFPQQCSGHAPVYFQRVFQ